MTEIKVCSRCGTPVVEMSQCWYCPQCGLPRTWTEVKTIEEVKP